MDWSSRATKRLVELGLLRKQNRGRIEVDRTRPAEYHVTERLKQFAQKSDTSVTPDHTGNPNLTDLPGGVTSHHTSTGVTSRHTLKKKDLTTTSTQASNNKSLNNLNIFLVKELLTYHVFIKSMVQHHI